VLPFTTEADAAASPTALLDVLTQVGALGVSLVSDGKRCRVRSRVCPPHLCDVIRQVNHTLAGLPGRTPGRN
jgi:hypothetical protein